MAAAFRLQSGAEADLAEALLWYEDQAAGLSLEFLRAVEARFAGVQRNPELYPIVYRGVRRALVRRFPYSVYYRIDPDSITVLACVHSRSDPRRWQSRA
jgi:plasmid stabilization system protein ParE